VKTKLLYYTGWTLTRVISKLIFRIRVSGREHFPSEGGFILATNHISWYDPLLVGSWSPRQVYFFAKQELFRSKVFGFIIRRTNALPVRRGTIDRKALDMSTEVIERGFGLTIFPEGTRSKIDGFLPPKPGVGMLSLRARCPIVLGYVHGSNKLWDCLLGKQRLSITYGPPIRPEEYAELTSDKESYQELAAEVMARIGRLKEGVCGPK
jgi:1-acyl-sn-glycerol-3-phosphate acyltransferase